MKQNWDSYKRQKDLKTVNRTGILEALKESPKRFKELQSITKLSPMGLTKALRDLQDEKKISKTIFDGHEGYEITKEGVKHVESRWLLINELLKLQDKNSLYIPKRGILEAGIRSIIIASNDKHQYRPPLSLTLPNEQLIHDVVFRDMVKAVLSKKVSISIPMDAKVIVATTIDYSVLTTFLKKVKLFVRCVEEDRNIFSEQTLWFQTSSLRNKLQVLLTYLRITSTYYDNQEFHTKTKTYLKQILQDNDKTSTQLMLNVSYDILKTFIRYIETDVEPLDDIVVRESIYKQDNVEGTRFESKMRDYIDSARILMYNDTLFLEKLDKYDKRISNELVSDIMARFRKQQP